MTTYHEARVLYVSRLWAEDWDSPEDSRDDDVFPDRPCETCGQPCQYPPQCRECAADEEGAAKRRAEQ